MSLEEREHLLNKKARALLDASTANLNSLIRYRLEEIRREVLGASSESRWRVLFYNRWKAFGALATAATGVAAVFLFLYSAPQEFTVKNPEDFEILTSQEPLDLYGNLDFYRWLAGKENGK